MKGNRRIRAAWSGLTLLTGLISGCASSPSGNVDISSAPSLTFADRSLSDERLGQFLVANLGRVPSTWDFESLSWVAFYYHPALELARAQWASTQAAQRTAGARPNPTLSVTPGFDSSRQTGVSPWFPAINLDFLFPTAGKRGFQRDLAKAEAEAARFSVIATAWAVRTELRSALNEFATALRREANCRAQAEVQRELLKLQQTRQEAGLSSSAEVATSRLALTRLDAALAEAISQRTAARLKVASALGLSVAALDGIQLPLSMTAQKMSTDAVAQARQVSLRSRADIIAALAKVASAEAAIAMETARRYPDLHIGPGYQYDQGLNKWSVALTLELPVFNRNEGPIAEALAKRAEAVAHLTAAQAQAINAIESAAAAESANTDQLAQARRVRDETLRQESLVLQRFKLGAADQIEVQTARLEVILAEATVAESAAAATQAGVQLEDALQLPFPHLDSLGEAVRTQNLKSP